MKSQSSGLLAIVRGIITDILVAYPDVPGLDRDFTRLSQIVESRGLGVFTLDLPMRDDLLLEGLAQGLLSVKGTKTYSKRCKVPRLFAGLYLRIFDKHGRLRPKVDVDAIAFLRQLLCIGKKIAVPCSKKRELIAIEEYIDVENELQEPTLSWELDSINLDGVDNNLHLRQLMADDLPLFPDLCVESKNRIKVLLDRCQRVADYVAEELSEFDADAIIDGRQSNGELLGLRHGPGAVAERSGRYFDKYQFANWSAKLGSSYPIEKWGMMPNQSRDGISHRETPARLISVPKTAKGPRLIAAEPSEHMFIQKLTQSWLHERVKATSLRYFINFSNQQLSGDLARTASQRSDLSTVDLSSASDRLSCKVVERIFRKNPSLLKALHAHRTRWIHIPQKEMYLKLNKFASQGTAVTFPIQTIVFLIIALSVSLKGPCNEHNLRKLRNKVRVYGDDIILPSTGYADIVDLLSTLQLKVNNRKSFSTGQFRESCGTDAYMGYDVTPCKPKTTIPDGPASCQAVIDYTNNLFYKGYWHASEQLKHRLTSHSRKRWPVVGRGAGATGLGSFSFNSILAEFQIQMHKRLHSTERRALIRALQSRTGISRIRWNRRLHRFEAFVQTFRSNTKIRPFDCGYSGLLDRAVSSADASVFKYTQSSGVPERPSLSNQRRWVVLTDLFG